MTGTCVQLFILMLKKGVSWDLAFPCLTFLFLTSCQLPRF